MAVFSSILYLDDVRMPKLHGVEWVRNYAEFVQYLDLNGMPDLISFDHDLAREHYPMGANEAGEKIPYSTYKEKTGLDCARFVIENELPLKNWAVHSMNVQGRINIERELRRYCRRGEVRGLQIPYEIGQAAAKGLAIPDEARPYVQADRSFSATSLLQFQEDLPLEGWEERLVESVARR